MGLKFLHSKAPGFLGIKGGKTHDRPFLKTNSQKMIVLKQMSYLASSLVETTSSEKVLRGIFNSISWHFDVAEFYPLELVSCRDELHKIF
jgi:hypothetical protein